MSVFRVFINFEQINLTLLIRYRLMIIFNFEQSDFGVHRTSLFSLGELKVSRQ